ncbi:pyrin domain-containing protein 2 [Peromyscus maniculatus bairdii]|uniref:pyrin domain-containing protein 2 n=1 Tax=Peromyscus maniculatus bairdii TaxID=230844 RepID=UPI003FCFE0EA
MNQESEVPFFGNLQFRQPEFNVKAFLANLKIDELKKFKFQLKTFPEFREDLQKSSCCEVDEADNVKLADILIKKLPSERLKFVTLSILDKIKNTELPQPSEHL